MRDTKWMQPQNWIRDTDGPCVSLGPSGDFDDMHLFGFTAMPKAPMAKPGPCTHTPFSNSIKPGNTDAYFIPPCSRLMVYI